jgi:hypothetical protein
MANRIKGTLDAVVDGRAIGWVWDPEAPEAALDVEVEVDGAPAAKATAEIERPMLAENGIGTGRYGFDIALPEDVAGEGEREIRVFAGPDRTPVPPFAEFETVSRLPESPWAQTSFVIAGSRRERVPFVPEGEDLSADPGAAALAGKDGWLFVKDERHLSDEKLTGAPLMSRQAAVGFAESLADRQRNLRELRLPYFLAVVPLRERFCEERLPDGVELHPRVPVAQVSGALRKSGSVGIVSLQRALTEAQRAGEPFSRTDSGWTDRGACYASRELLWEAGKRVITLDHPPPIDEATFASEGDYLGDLAEKPRFQLREKPRTASEEIEIADVSKLRALRMPAPEHLEVTGRRAPQLYEIEEAPQLPRAVLVGDASCLKLIPWMAEHFSRFVFLWAGLELPLEAIELEAPDIVIQVVTESLLLNAG